MTPSRWPEPIGLAEALAIARARTPEPDEVLSHPTRGPYLRKWIVEKRADGSSLCVHEFLRSDGDDEMHDHTADCETLVLEGGYWEVTPEGRRWLGAGDRHRRAATDFHRVELEPGVIPLTLFAKGPRRNEWAFLGADGARIAPADFARIAEARD